MAFHVFLALCSIACACAARAEGTELEQTGAPVPVRQLATGRFSWATRSDRFFRFLPGAKASSGGSSSSSTPARKNCQGTWSSWGSCTNGQQSRSFTTTSSPSGGGTPCPSSPEKRSCQDCVGRYSCWSPCDPSTLKQSRTYRIITEKSGSGSACPAADGASVQRSCTLPDHKIAWTYYEEDKSQWSKSSLADVTPIPKATELTVVHCDVGQTVEFTWESQASAKAKDSQATGHDLWQLSNEEDYAKCAFDSSTSSELVPHAASVFPASYTAAPEVCSHQFSCNTQGTHFFACSVAGACHNGMQRVRIWVTDSSKTETLRAQQPQLTTLSSVMSDHLVPVAYSDNEGPVSDDVAANISTMLASIQSLSPEACADWLAPNDLTDAMCKAFALTDRGFIERVRATPNFTLAQSYYTNALALVSGFCPAESYLTELRVKEADKSAADAQFAVACNACGTNSLDMTDVRLAYHRKGWAVPSNSACSEDVPKRLTSSELQLAVQEATANADGASPSPLQDENLGDDSLGHLSRRQSHLAAAMAVMATVSMVWGSLI